MSHKHLQCALAVTVVLVAAGCSFIFEALDPRGPVVAKAELTQPGTAETRFIHQSGAGYILWATLSGKHRSNQGRASSTMPIIYDVDVVEPGKPVVRITCDARSTTMAVCGSQTNLFGELDAECEVKLPCTLPPLGSSEVVLRVAGRAAEPARILLIRDMSVVVREEKK